jgi:LCP family protein required for cell wall assembly
LGLNCLVILVCFAGAAGLLISRHLGNGLARVDLGAQPGTTAPAGVPTGNVTEDTTAPPSDSAPVVAAPVETFPSVDPEAKNFLITGADNNACIDPNSPYAAAFGDREEMGERSDTIMLMRVDPSTRRAAVLSFPRDLWVKIDGRSGRGRINSAYVRDDPTRLRNTLYGEFGLPVDHFIQVDFCAFKVMVEAVGGVTVPFAYPARDTHTGLNVPEPGCYTFDGDHALAYVRSRYYQYFEDGEWKSDPASDLGRVSRQQDFLRRVLSSALAKGFDPGVARDMIRAATDHVVLDNELTITRMLEFAGILSDFEPGSLMTYQIEADGENIGGNSVLVPDIDGENMQLILSMFRGGAPLAEAPEQVFDTTSTTSDPDAPPSTDTLVTDTTLVTPEEIVKGIVPPDDMEC